MTEQVEITQKEYDDAVKQAKLLLNGGWLRAQILVSRKPQIAIDAGHLPNKKVNPLKLVFEKCYQSEDGLRVITPYRITDSVKKDKI